MGATVGMLTRIVLVPQCGINSTPPRVTDIQKLAQLQVYMHGYTWTHKKSHTHPDSHTMNAQMGLSHTDTHNMSDLHSHSHVHTYISLLVLRHCKNALENSHCITPSQGHTHTTAPEHNLICTQKTPQDPQLSVWVAQGVKADSRPSQLGREREGRGMNPYHNSSTYYTHMAGLHRLSQTSKKSY
jgi:hypothetical protein